MATPQTLPLKIRVAKPLFATLQEMASLTSTPTAGFAAQLIEAAVADFRLRNITKDFPMPPRGECFRSSVIPPSETSRQKVDAAKAKQILRALDQGVPVVEIAERNGVAASTIRRVRDRRAQYAEPEENHDDEI